MPAVSASVELEGTMTGGAESPRQPPGETGAPLSASSSEAQPEAASNEGDGKPGNCGSVSLSEGSFSAQDPALPDQDLFNSFHFWRTPLPNIDLDMELEQGTGGTPSPEGAEETPEVPGPISANITMATRKELEEMIENLEPHIDDPDVKGMGSVGSSF